MEVNGRPCSIRPDWERVEAGLEPVPELLPPLTGPIADSPVLDDEVAVQSLEDLNLPLEVPLLVWPAVL